MEGGVGLSDTLLKGDHSRTIPARGEDLNVIKPLSLIKPNLAGIVLE
jgi:hypothetical protein